MTVGKEQIANLGLHHHQLGRPIRVSRDLVAGYDPVENPSCHNP